MHENTNRCNGHIQVSPTGKTPKRDRKGCKKGKIEMIMKNSMGSTKPKVHIDSIFKKKTKLLGQATNHFVHAHHNSTGPVIKNEIIDDPYAFTDSEPLAVGLYSGANSLSLARKVVPVTTTAAANHLQPPPPHQVQAQTQTMATTHHRVTTVCGSGGASVEVTTNSVQTHEVYASPTNSGKPAGGSNKVNKMVSTNTEGSSKTMNQLQADIARNRVIVKRRKVVYQPSSSHDEQNHHQPHHHHHHHHSSSGGKWAGETVTAARTFARVSIPAKRLQRQTTWQRERRTRHEALQRIQEAQQKACEEKRDMFPLGLEVSESEVEEEEEGHEVYQRHWFMGWGAGSGSSNGMSVRGRESRLTQLRSELRRRLRQVWRGVERMGEPPPTLVHAVVTAARTQPGATALLLHPRLLASYSKQSRAKVSMLGVKQCSLCNRRALPCTRHCNDHIMYNVDQLLFEYCTAKLGDNTQCRIPVFDVAHQSPLCPQHARSQHNSVKIQPDTTPKKSRKKNKPSTLNRSRSKKKKKPRPVGSAGAEISPLLVPARVEEVVVTSTTAPLPAAVVDVGNGHPATAPTIVSIEATPVVTPLAAVSSVDVFHPEAQVPQVEIEVQLEDGVEEVPEEVLAIASSLDPAELASQTSRLLEDHDIRNMLNIPPDAFNDLFTEDKNGEYEPTREETEELERALEAVDKDVRSLERTLTRSSMPLPLPLPLSLPLETMTLLDDVPNVYNYSNGFTSVQTDLRHS